MRATDAFGLHVHRVAAASARLTPRVELAIRRLITGRPVVLIRFGVPPYQVSSRTDNLVADIPDRSNACHSDVIQTSSDSQVGRGVVRVTRRRLATGLSHQSDRSCQFTSLAFGQRLLAAGLTPSTGSVGDCVDNAVVESLFASLNVELLHRRDWPTRAAARLAIVEAIAVWYNRQRLNSTLDDLTPVAFETRAHVGVAA